MKAQHKYSQEKVTTGVKGVKSGQKGSKRAKRAKCGHFSGQFSRCCLWGQKRPRPVCCLMEAADAFPSNCRRLCSRVNDGIIGVNVGLYTCVCVTAAA